MTQPYVESGRGLKFSLKSRKNWKLQKKIRTRTDSPRLKRVAGRARAMNSTRHDPRPVRHQPLASSTFLSEQTSHQQPANSTFLSEQTSTSHQPPAKRTGCRPEPDTTLPMIWYSKSWDLDRVVPAWPEPLVLRACD
jgi:hypothetical protein